MLLNSGKVKYCVSARSQIRLSSICEHNLSFHPIDRGVAHPTGDVNIKKNIKCEPMTTRSEAEFCDRAFCHLILLNPELPLTVLTKRAYG
jgi:hypothetical protein